MSEPKPYLRLTVTRLDDRQDNLSLTIPNGLTIAQWSHYFHVILTWIGYAEESMDEVFGKDWENIDWE